MHNIQFIRDNSVEFDNALKKRDITNLDLVQIDPWPAGGVVHESIKQGHRAMKTISFEPCAAHIHEVCRVLQSRSGLLCIDLARAR